MELSATANLIVENPYAWRERTELMRGIHAVPVHPYTIFYRIADHSPEIVRVLHERRDTSSFCRQKVASNSLPFSIQPSDFERPPSAPGSRERRRVASPPSGFDP